MDEHIAALLGIDLSDPEVAQASRETEQVMNLIETLVRHRKARRISQKTVAESMGTTQSAVSDFERLGGDPKLTTIFRYAHAVGLNLPTMPYADGGGERKTTGWTPVNQSEEYVPRAHRRKSA